MTVKTLFASLLGLMVLATSAVAIEAPDTALEPEQAVTIFGDARPIVPFPTGGDSAEAVAPPSSLGIADGVDALLDVPVRSEDNSQFSVGMSQWRFPGGATTAWLAAEHNFPDSMAAGAYADTAPFLLTSKDQLDPEVAAELRRLDVNSVVIVGGLAAVGADVEQQLAQMGLSTQRLAGASRHATAAEAARFVLAERGPGTHPVVISRDDNVADSLAVVEYAGATDATVLLAGANRLPDETRQVLADHAATVSEVVIVGGTAAISAAVEDQLRQLGLPVRRVAGESRVETAYAMYRELPGADPDQVYVLDPYADNAWALAYTAADRRGTSRLALVANGRVPAATDTFLRGLEGRHDILCLSQAGACDDVADVLDQPLWRPASTDGVSGGFGSVVSFDGLVIPGVMDYATHVIGDPWDYGNAEDIILEPNITNGVDDLAMRDGLVTFTTHSGGGYVHALFPGYNDGALLIGRDGIASPIDGSVYSQVTARVHVSRETHVRFSFQTCADLPPGQCSTEWAQILMPGWHVINFAHELDQPIYGVQFGANHGEQVDVQLDWLRIHSSSQTVSASGLGRGALAVTADGPGLEGLVPVITRRGVSAGAAPPGSYTVRATDGTTTRLLVVEPPRMSFLNPDQTGGEDYITAATGDAWDFDRPEDAALIGHADWRIEDGWLIATNNGAVGPDGNQNDPFVKFRMSGTVDPQRYHRVTVTFANEGGFDLADAPGGGSHGRLLWERPTDGPEPEYHDGAEIVAYPNLDTYTFSMHSPGASESDPRSDGGVNQWHGSGLSQIRFDPNEDPGTRSWQMAGLQLRADDESTGEFTLELAEMPALHDVDEPPVTATVRLDDDRSGGDGVVVASDVPLRRGTTTLPISTCDLPAGTYWGHVTASRGPATSSTYSSGPLQVLNTAC